jgi:tetratricopeptide (TPR) repeat protein
LARLAAGVFFLAAAAGCSSLMPQTKELARALPQGLPEKVELTQTPFFPQLEYQCGPAALATVLVSSGVKTTPDQLVAQVYIPERKGSLQVEMLAAARRHGLISYALAPRFEDLLREIAAGTPVIVLQNLGVFTSGWHYAVAIGYDYPGGTLVLRSGTQERDVMPFAAHEVVWMRSNYWAMVAVPPGRIPATAEENSWLGAIAAFERVGGAQGARVAYKNFLARWPENVNAHVGLANAHYALGDLKDAEAVLRDAVRRDPESVVALNNLAQTLSDLGRNDEALPIIERASAAGGPFASAVQKTRETILQRLGRQGSGVERIK